MANTTRRSFLSRTGIVAAVVASGAVSTGATASASRPAAPPPELFGTAALTAALVAMAVDGDTAYVVTRGQTPPKVVTVDLASRTVTNIVRLSRGDGGWAATVSGGKVYVGTYPTPDLFRYDPGTDEVELLGTIGPEAGFVWCLTTAPDGTVYAGTSPRGEVWEFRPDTGDLRNLGRVHEEVQFARVIAADDHYVYAGTTPLRHIIAIDRSTGEKSELIPESLAGAGSVDAVIATGDRLIASAGGNIIDMARDGSDVTIMPAPGEPSMVDAVTLTADGALYGVARRDGTIYRRSGDTLEIVGTANVGDETRTLSLQDPMTLIGAGGSGVLWCHDLDTGETDMFDLTDTDVAGPDLVQSISLGPERTVYVGGHFYLTVHRPWEGTSSRFRIAGEAKALLPMGDKVLAALYPSSEVIEVDPRTGDVQSLGFTEQQRPWEMIHDSDRGLVLIASAPGSGELTGALTVLDLATGDMQNYPVLPDQSVMSVTLADGVAYLAGDTWGGGSITPVRQTAQVAAFDLDTRTVLWRHEPLPESPSMQHVEVHDGVLYGVYKRISGTWFAMDLATREILHQGTLSGYGEIVTHRDQVFAATNFADNISRIGPGLAEAELLVGPIDTSWFTVPQLEFERRSWRAWGVAGRELARFDLHPRYRPLPSA